MQRQISTKRGGCHSSGGYTQIHTHFTEMNMKCGHILLGMSASPKVGAFKWWVNRHGLC